MVWVGVGVGLVGRTGMVAVGRQGRPGLGDCGRGCGRFGREVYQEGETPEGGGGGGPSW